ncbi:MAG: glycosyltransferase family 1 protein [Butyrivibrio sp.]|nr:glycosyltransferase family 1 protein [Butyrivibrio sp.]
MNEQKPIRVLQIIGIVCGGGVESVIMNYYRNMDRRKVQFDFVIDGKDKSILDDEIVSLGGKVYHVTPYKENIIKYMHDIYLIMISHEHNIVHDNMNTMAFFSLLPAWLAGKKIRILHNHTTNYLAESEKMKYIMKSCLRPFAKIFANKLFACSNKAGEWIYGSKNMKNGKVRIINNAIDESYFSYSKTNRDKLRRELGISDETIVIGHVGRMVPPKNHIFILDVFKSYHKKNNDSVLMLIGDGPLREKIRVKAKEIGIENRVYFLGHRNDVAACYSAMDLFVLPSLYEGLPVVAIEAQANGLPICMSTAITDEVIIADNAVRLDLREDKWVLEMMRLIKRERNCTCSILHENNFSIQAEAKKLQDWYLMVELE